MKAKRIHALILKPGATRGGEPSTPVGGEMVPIDKLSVFLSSSWILVLLILMLPIVFILYRKRDMTMKFLSPLVSRLFDHGLLR